jgi:hypothetical protein
MLRELKSTTSYGRAMACFSILTLIFGLATSFAGEIFIPLATAFCAAIFVFEKPERRFLSFVIPIALILIDFTFNGFLSLIAIEVITLSVIISVFYVKKSSKAEATAYIVFAMSLFIIATLYILGAQSIKSFSPTGVAAYYKEMFTELKEYFIDNVLTVSITDPAGTVSQFMTEEEAIYYVNQMANALPSIIAIFAFAIAGVSLKIFCAIMRRSCKYGLLKTYSHFYTSSLVAYAYVAIAIIAALASSEAVFDIAIQNVSNILMVVFAYVGLRYVLAVAALSQRRVMIYILTFAALISMSGIAVQLLSYFGVFINISVNRQISATNDGGKSA